MTYVCVIPTGDLSLGICRPAAFPIHRRPTVAKIASEVEQFYGVDIKRRGRQRDVARPRQVAMYLARTMTDKSYPTLARLFGNFNHTTLIHAIRNVERLIEEDSDFAVDVEVLRMRIAGL